MRLLLLNCGSSSLRFRLVQVEAAGDGPGEGAIVLAHGRTERIGARARRTWQDGSGDVVSDATPTPDHHTAVDDVLRWLATRVSLSSVDAVGHRVVHGGRCHRDSTTITDEVLSAIAEAVALAPLHNAPCLAGIRACQLAFGAAVPMVAVFDSSFHRSMPEMAARYAIPDAWASRYDVRRYGFHGTAFRSVLSRYHALTGTHPSRTTLIALHLGSGCSAVAIRDGLAVDTSMGLTPLEGLVMGSRSGDVDPGLLTYLVRIGACSVSEGERILAEESGLRGLSGISGDMREVLAARATSTKAALAVDAFCYRARKYVGAYFAAIGGADALVFSGGIGEHSPDIRREIVDGLDCLGFRLDPARNDAAIGTAACISEAGAPRATWVIPADEESVMASDVVACVRGRA